MVKSIEIFESIARKAYRFTARSTSDIVDQHPFESRNIHENIPDIVRRLFDDGHYSHATFEAYKYIDKEVARLASKSATGYKLMMDAFNEQNPLIKLNSMISMSEKDEQIGYKFLFAGGMSGIRNPRGHEYDMKDDIETCISHLGLGSMLLRKLEEAGHQLSKHT